MRVAYRPDIIATSIVESLRRTGWEALPDSDPGSLIAAGKADVAIGPALGYGAHLGIIDYGLVPRFVFMISGPSNLIRLLFHPGRSELRRIGVRDLESMETVLAGLVLIEKHDIEPEFIEFSDETSVDEMLESADGVVVWGEESLRSEVDGRSALDLGDEWVDMTGESLPWILAWGRSDRVTEAALEELDRAREEYSRNLPDLAASSVAERETVELLHGAILSENVQFGLETEEASERLTPFFHYAFYHGIIADIPTIKHLPIEQENQ